MDSRRNERHDDAPVCQWSTNLLKAQLSVKQSLLAVCLLLGGFAASSAKALSWSNCNQPLNSVLQLLSFNPASWVAGGEDTLQFTFDLGEVIGGTNELTIHVEHRVNGRLLPCLGPLAGSCTYQLCNTLDQHFTDVWGGPDCPLSEWDIACQCPYNRGTYLVPSPGLTFAVPDRLERFHGHNELRVTGNTAAGTALFCVDLSFDIAP
jgi:hypothetical protein